MTMMIMMMMIVAMSAESAQGGVVTTLVSDDKCNAAAKRTASKRDVSTNIGQLQGGNNPARSSDCSPR